jgi:parallel beta-helix repeat protein
MALFKQIFASDPNNPQNVATNGVISIFAPGTRTLLAIKTAVGGALSNPLQLNSLGFGPAFAADGYTQVAWEAVTPGQVFQGTFESYEGVLAQAVAAKEEAAAGAAAELTQLVAAGEFNGKDGSNVLPTQQAIQQEFTSGPVAEKLGKFSSFAAAADSSLGNGSTNATTHLQGKLTAGAGKVTYIPAGTYNVTALTVPAGSTVMAEGVVLQQTGGGSAPVLTLGAGANIFGIRVLGNRAGGATGHGILATAGAKLRLRSVTVEEVGGNGVRLNDVTDYRLDDVVVRNVSQQGINLVFSSRGRINACVVDTAQHGIQWWGGDSAATGAIGIWDIAITGCIVKNIIGRAGASLGGGIWGSLGSRITVTGNTIDGCTDVGIDFEGGEWSTASGNTIRNCINGGLAVFYAAHDCTFTGNTVINDTITGPAFKAFASPRGPNARITVADNVLVSANTFALVTDAQGLIDSAIRGNTLRVTTATSAAARILDSDRIDVHSNIAEVAGAGGVLIEGGRECTIIGNSVRCVGTDTSTLGQFGGIVVQYRDGTYNGRFNVIRENTVRGFVTGLKDGNTVSATSANIWQNNLADTMWHRGTINGSYFGYYSENRKATSPKDLTVVTIGA